MRPVILIESEVPENDTLPPVPRSFDIEIRLSHQQIAFLPFAARTLSQPDAFRGEMIVEFGLSFRPAPVAMCGSACGEFRGAGIAQDLLGKVEQVPVVIEGQDLCLEMSVSKRRAQMFADEDGLFLGGHPHARIISWNGAPFVLRSNGKEGYARGFVRLHEAHEVASQRVKDDRSSVPPIMEPEVFIHPGGLQGLAMILRWGLTASASRRTGRIYWRSRSMVKRFSLRSDFPGGTSS